MGNYVSSQVRIWTFQESEFRCMLNVCEPCVGEGYPRGDYPFRLMEVYNLFHQGFTADTDRTKGRWCTTHEVAECLYCHNLRVAIEDEPVKEQVGVKCRIAAKCYCHGGLPVEDFECDTPSQPQCNPKGCHAQYGFEYNKMSRSCAKTKGWPVWKSTPVVTGLFPKSTATTTPGR